MKIIKNEQQKLTNAIKQKGIGLNLFRYLKIKLAKKQRKRFLQ